MARGLVAMSVHGLVVAAAVALALWAVGASAGAARYDTATPYTPPHNKYKYIPLHSNYKNEEPIDVEKEEDTPSSGTSTSELILSIFRTALDVVRKINNNRSQKSSLPTGTNSTSIQFRGKNGKNDTVGTGRGMQDYYDEHYDHDHDHDTTTTAKPMKQGRYTDPWAGYYDWLINEGSFKFWSVFQLFTAALLLYACFSAIYYAKFNPILPDYSMEYDDYFLERTVGRNARSIDASASPSGLTWMNPTTFQFILDAISKHYLER